MIKKILVAGVCSALAVTTYGAMPALADDAAPADQAPQSSQQQSNTQEDTNIPAPTSEAVPFDETNGTDATPDARKAVVKPTSNTATNHGKAYGAWKNINVSWDWTMPRGVPNYMASDLPYPEEKMQPIPGYPDSGNSLYGPLPDGANPAYSVTLTSSKTSAKGVAASKLKCSWVVNASPKVSLGAAPCSQNRNVQLKEGTYPVTLTVNDTAHKVVKVANSKITVKNTLIAITGDSYASGEGMPPINYPGLRAIGSGKVLWDEPACHRLRWSGFVRAAINLENASNRSNVTMVDVACSGAQVQVTKGQDGVAEMGGMLSPQKQWTDDGESNIPGTYLKPQVDQLSEIAQGKKYDVTLMSIGGNDAGLVPVVNSCMVFDAMGAMLSTFWTNFNNGKTNWTSCAFAGQAYSSINFQQFSQTKFYCMKYPNDSAGATYIHLSSNCNPDDAHPALHTVVDGNLERLEQHYANLSRCLGGSLCMTQKLVDDTPSDNWTASAGVPLASKSSVNQAMYPDLTHRENTVTHKGLEFCGVQDDPEKAPGLAFYVDDDTDWIDPSKWKVHMEDILNNEMVSPLNQITNSWAYGAFYEGVKGQSLSVMQPADYPKNVPGWEDNSASIPLGANGLVKQLEDNEKDYGWTPGFAMYDKSHTHGLCATHYGASWTDTLTDAAAQGAFSGGTGTGLHPNPLGQAAYADMLTPMTAKSAGPLPGAPKNSIVPVKVKKTSLSLTKSGSKKIKKSSKVKLKLKIGGVAKGQKVQVLVRNSSQKKQQVINVTVKGGSATVVLTKKMTKGKKKAWVTAVAQYQGNLTIGNSKSKTVKLTIK